MVLFSYEYLSTLLLTPHASASHGAESRRRSVHAGPDCTDSRPIQGHSDVCLTQRQPCANNPPPESRNTQPSGKAVNGAKQIQADGAGYCTSIMYSSSIPPGVLSVIDSPMWAFVTVRAKGEIQLIIPCNGSISSI